MWHTQITKAENWYNSLYGWRADYEDLCEGYWRGNGKKDRWKMIKMGKLTREEIGLCVPTLSFDELKEFEVEIIQIA